jgi:hypothetical protein
VPFTISHPAIVHPIHNYFRWMSFPALVIGSMMPDAGYFFPFHNYLLQDAHTLVRSFTFCLPMGWFFMALFYFFRRPFAFLLFEPHRSRLRNAMKTPKTGFSFFFVVSLSLVIGAWTHIIWDSFTHKTGYFVQNITLLQSPIFEIRGSPYFLFNLLQHISSLVGLSYLILVYFNWVSSDRKNKKNLISFEPARAGIWLAVWVATIVGCVQAAPDLPIERGLIGWRISAFNLITTFLGTFFIILLAVLVAIKCGEILNFPKKVFQKMQK